MRTSQKILSITKAKFLSPLLYNSFNSSEDKRVKSEIFNSFVQYKKFPFSNNFRKGIHYFINPFSFLRKNSSSNLLLSKRNYNNNIRKKEFTHIKGNFNLKNKNKNKRNFISQIRNKTVDNKNNSEENRFKSRYKYLIRNLSFNGNSRVYFKNLSNEILDGLFKYKPYNSFNVIKPMKNFKKEKEKKIIKHKYENIINRIKRANSSVILGEKNYNNNYTKESNDINCLRSKNIFSKKITDFNKETKKINFENQILKNESKELELFSEYNQNTPATSTREKNKSKNKSINTLIKENKKNFLRSKKSIKASYGVKFKALKMKLRKQNDVNSNLINDIRKEQSLSKYKLQIGIVKLNGYKPKNRKDKKYRY